MSETQLVIDDPLGEVRKLRREVTGKNSILMKKAPHVDVRCTYDNDVLMELLGEIKSLRDEVTKQREEIKHLSIENREIREDNRKMKEDQKEQDKMLLEQFKDLEVITSEVSTKFRTLEVSMKVSEEQQRRKMNEISTEISSGRKDFRLLFEKLIDDGAKTELSERTENILSVQKISQKKEEERAANIYRSSRVSKTVADEIIGTWKLMHRNGKNVEESIFWKFKFDGDTLKNWYLSATTANWVLYWSKKNEFKMDDNKITFIVDYGVNSNSLHQSVTIRMENGNLLLQKTIGCRNGMADNKAIHIYTMRRVT